VRLYHGSTVVVEKPAIIRSERGRDFGYGFYTTDIHDQARRWASRKARIELNKGNKTRAIVSMYDFDETAFDSLSVMRFPEPSMEWLDMVCICRSDASFSHTYDLVIGKVANDAVGETVTYVVQGIMRKEDALQRLRFEKINNQFCFSYEKSLEFLHFVNYEEVPIES
jgi:hypothetical protein